MHFLTEFLRVFYILNINHLSDRYVICKYVFPACTLSFHSFNSIILRAGVLIFNQLQFVDFLFFNLWGFFCLFVVVFLAVLGLRCCARAFSRCGEWGLLFVAVRGLPVAVASRCGARALGVRASVVAACQLSSWRHEDPRARGLQ